MKTKKEETNKEKVENPVVPENEEAGGTPETAKNAEANGAVEAIEAPKPVKASKKTSKKISNIEDIPDKIKKVLEIFCNHKELYVGEGGEVFTADTEKGIVEGYTLYVNPYYNE